jgi:sigma-B regulation protein RsbU (phosphoserine phosphatase)
MDAALRTAPCYYFSCREDGTLLDVNDALYTRLGYSRPELEEKKADTLFTIATRIFFQTHLGPMLKMQGQASEIFISLQTKEGDSVPVLVNAKRSEGEGETSLAFVGIEVQNRKRFEDELINARKLAEDALQDNTALATTKQELETRLSELDYQISLVSKQNNELRQLNKVITHDLQEPLRKLSVFSNLVLNPSPNFPLQTIGEKLQVALSHMRLIVSGLQQYMWLTDTMLQPAIVDIAQLVEDIKEQLQDEHPSTSLLFEVFCEHPVFADEAQIKILLYQLLSNVVRFRKEGNVARARISGIGLMLNKYKAIEGKYKYAQFTRLQVTDEGLGFNNDYHEKAFELFKRLHAESGIGIGLALCRKIADNHGGSISISSQEGIGSVVTVLFPEAVQQVEKSLTLSNN